MMAAMAMTMAILPAAPPKALATRVGALEATKLFTWASDQTSPVILAKSSGYCLSDSGVAMAATMRAAMISATNALSRMMTIRPMTVITPTNRATSGR